MGILDRFKKSAPAEAPAKSEEESELADSPADNEGQSRRGFFARLKQGLKKTNQLLFTDVRDLFKGEGRLVDDAFLEELRRILVRTDMGPQAAAENIEEVRTQFRARVVQMDDILNVVKQKLKQLMAQDEAPLKLAAAGPTVIMVCGVNGSGKTTSIAKLAKHFLSQEKKVVLGAGDTFRAAAVEQLGIWATRLGAEVVKGPSGSDPASVAFSAVKKTIESSADICIVDTAGRLQTQQNLMAELTKIHRVIGKQIPEAPARGVIGDRRHRRSKRHQPGARFFRGGELYRYCVGEDRWHSQRGRHRTHPAAVRFAGEAGGDWRKGRRSGRVSPRRIRRRHVRRPGCDVNAAPRMTDPATSCTSSYGRNGYIRRTALSSNLQARFHTPQGLLHFARRVCHEHIRLLRHPIVDSLLRRNNRTVAAAAEVLTDF